VSQDEAQRLSSGAAQERFSASGGISPDYMCMDSTIPRKRLAEMLLAIQAMNPSTSFSASTCFTRATAIASAHPVRRQ